MNQNAIREELKRAEEHLSFAIAEEEKTGEAMDSMERRYWEGYLEALGLAVSLLIREGK